ncbi:hypothetical protein VPH35_008797 [Triticum aestivum]
MVTCATPARHVEMFLAATPTRTWLLLGVVCQPRRACEIMVHAGPAHLDFFLRACLAFHKNDAMPCHSCCSDKLGSMSICQYHMAFWQIATALVGNFKHQVFFILGHV